MMVTYFEPHEVWPAFQANKTAEDNSLLIAENTDYGIEISVVQDGDLPVIIVCSDDEDVFQEAVVSQNDCEQTVKKVYENYLDGHGVVQYFLDNDKPQEDSTSEEILDEETEILDREDELQMAMLDFLQVVMDGCVIDDDEVISDCVDHFLEYIARKWGYQDIRRPMILEDEDGEEFFEEYPYEVMEYDDPDNPIYQ